MKKLLTISLLALTVLFLLAGCGKEEAKCEFCGETKSGETVTVLGEEAHVCDDCMDEVKEYLG